MRIALAALVLTGTTFAGLASTTHAADAVTATARPTPAVDQGWSGEEPIFLPPPLPPPPDATAPATPGRPATPAAASPLPWDAPAPLTPTPDPMPATPSTPVISAPPALPQPPTPAPAFTGPYPSTPAAGQMPGMAAAAEQPLPARIKVDGTGKVNLRAGPGTEFEIITAAIANTPITVYASITVANDKWYKIGYPETDLVSVPASFITTNLPAEMPAEGVAGLVNSDGVKVYARHWDRSTVVGEMSLNEPVTVKRVRGSWLQIAPPPSARAYCAAQYVQLLQQPAAPIPTDAAPAQNPNLAVAGTAPEGAAARRTGPKLPEKLEKSRQDYLNRIQRNWERMVNDDEEEVRRMQEAEKNRVSPVEQFDAALSQVAQRSYTARNLPEYRSPGADRMFDPTQTGFTGWVEYVGRFGNRPGAFKLTKGGETRFFLRSNKVKLEDYNLKRVWVNGYSETIPGAEANVLVVEEVRILGEPAPFENKDPLQQRFPDTGPIADPRDLVNAPIVETVEAGQTGGQPAGRRDLPETISANVIPMGRSRADSGAVMPEQIGTPLPSPTPIPSNNVQWTTETTEVITTTATSYPSPTIPVIPTQTGPIIQDYAVPPTPSTPVPAARPGDLPAYVGP